MSSPDPSNNISIFQWAVGLILTAYGIVFGTWNIHIQGRVDDLLEKTTATVDKRHQENLNAIEALRTDIERLNDTILEDKRQEISFLRQEIRALKGQNLAYVPQLGYFLPKGNCFFPRLCGSLSPKPLRSNQNGRSLSRSPS